MTATLACLGPDTVHVVVDMQRLFDEDTGWRVPTLCLHRAADRAD